MERGAEVSPNSSLAPAGVALGSAEALRGQPRRASRREWLGLAVMALPCLIYSMDVTVLNLALPRLSAALSPTNAQLLWIVDIYGFCVSGFLITMGNLGDRIGRRRLLLMGAAFFAFASLLAAFARSASMLIAARAILGLAGATVAPSTLSLIRNMFLDPRQRSVAIGVWISSYSLGGVVGPILGGLMLQFFWWGSVFLLAVPVMVLLLVLGPLFLPEFRDPEASPLDIASAGLSLAAILAIVFGIKHAAEHGVHWASVVSLSCGLVLGGVFLQRQKRLPQPLVDLRLFREPGFGALLGTFTLSSLSLFGAYVFVGQYLQLVLKLSPLAAGLWLVPWSLGFVVGSLGVPRLARHVPPLPLMAIGLLVATVGFAVLTQIERGGLSVLVTGLILLSLGFAPVFTLGTDAIVGAAPPERAGAAGALSETSFEVGGALGIALLGSAATWIYRREMRPLLSSAALPAEARKAAGDTLGELAALAPRLDPTVGRPLLAAGRTAFTHAMQATVIVALVITVGIAALAALAWRRERRKGRSGPS